MTDRTVRVVLEGVVTGFRNNIRQAGQTVRTEGGAMLRTAEQNRASWTALGVAMGAAGGAIALGLRRAGRENIAFESSLTRSTTLVGVAREEMDEMGQAALRMAHTGQGPLELADALFFVQSAGLRGQAALDVLESSAMAASLGLGETKVVADLVTSAVNAYGLEVLSASQATDILIGAVREGKAEAPQLAGALGRVLPIASEMDVRFEQVGAAVAAMTRTGTDAATATTQLRAILVSLLNPTQQVEQAMADMGVSADDVRRTIREDGLWQAMMDLRDATGGNEQALGQLFPNVRALAGFLDLTGANAAENAEIFERLADTTGLLADGFEEWSTTSEAAVARFSAASQSARIALMEGLEGPLVAVLDAGTAMAEMFVDLPAPMRATIGIFLAASAAVLIFGGATLIALTRVNQLRGAMVAAGAQAVTFRGALASTARFAGGPWGAAIAAAALVVGVFAAQAAESRSRVEQLASTLDQQTGAVTDSTRAWLANELAARSLTDTRATVLEQARRLGIAEEDLIGAIMGQEGATRRVNAVIGEHHSAWDLTRGIWSISARDAVHVRNAIEQLREELEKSEDRVVSTAEVIDALNPELVQVAENFDLVGESSAEAAAEMLQAWSESFTQFFSLTDAHKIALDEKTEHEREAAQAAIEANSDIADSWQELVGDVELTADEYIGQLERMVNDQREWSNNMIELSGRIPPAMLDELMQMGPEGAQAVALLNSMTDEQLQETVRLWGQAGGDAGDAMAQRIADTGPVLQLIAEQLGADVAEGVARLMVRTGMTVEEAARALGIHIDDGLGGDRQIRVDPFVGPRQLSAAERELARLARERSVRLTPTVGPTQGHLPGQFHATGGLVTGIGGPTADNQLVAASPGEFMMRAAAVDHFGVGFMQAVNSLRVPGFAGGGMVGPVSSVRATGGGGRGASGAARLVVEVVPAAGMSGQLSDAIVENLSYRIRTGTAGLVGVG